MNKRIYPATNANKRFRYREGLHLIPTRVVARYRDPAIDTEHPSQRNHMRRLTRAIERDGVRDPLMIKVEDDQAHLFDGHHRLAVALRLEITACLFT
jgi:tRNA A-37 threonylcarbamoyl transferase component Bud32